jgi:hypothetical protein
MKLQQLKTIFTQSFQLEPTAANARKVLKNEGKSIVRNDFRCTKTWELMLDSFGLLSAARAFEARREQQERARKARERDNDPNSSFNLAMAASMAAYEANKQTPEYREMEDYIDSLEEAYW